MDKAKRKFVSKEKLYSTLRKHDNNKTHAATELGITRERLRSLLAHYAAPSDDRGVIQDPEETLKGKVKQYLLTKRSIITLSQLSDIFDCGVGKVKSIVDGLEKSGHTVKIKGETVIFNTLIEKSENTNLSVSKMTTGQYKFGACGDNHLCSRYERLDVLNALYDIYEQEGISVVYNTGNWIDGEARFNKHDLHTHGMDNQIKYFLENYPQRKGITTRFVTGDDHEGWYTQREGVDIGYTMQLRANAIGRTDIVYMGHMEHDDIIKAPNGQTKIRTLHPGGGSSYAISYTPQKIVESYTGGDKPDIVLIGHYHKMGYNYYRGVHCIQTGTTEDQTPFMRKKRLAAHLGGTIFEFGTDDNGAVTRFKSEFIPFYDKSYYKGGWAYKW